MGDQTGEQDIQTTVTLIQNEVLELEKQKSELLAHLSVLEDAVDVLEDSIDRKRARADYLKNSLVPVHRLPNEILLSCFHQAVQVWLCENDRTDGRIRTGELAEDFHRSRNPAIVFSHVSRHWRQLAINAPSLWNNIIITSNFDRHIDVLQDFIRRVDNVPITASFQNFFSWPVSPCSTDEPVVDAVMPLLQAQQVSSLNFIHSSAMFSCLFSRVAKQSTKSPPPLDAFSHLTTLAFVEHSSVVLNLNHLILLLSATPKLRHLELALYHDRLVGSDQPAVNLPSLEKLTLMSSYPDFLGCFSVPALHHLQLTSWFVSIGDCFLINDSPRFPNIEHLTLVESTYTYHQYQHLVRAFPRVTHLTLRNPYQLTNLSWQNQSSPSWSNLRRVTFHLTFSAISHYEPYYCHFGWLGRHEDQARQALQICVLDSSRERGGDADKRLFWYYKALEKYGTLEGSRLDKFLKAKAYFSEFTEFGGHRFDQLWDSKSNPYYL